MSWHVDITVIMNQSVKSQLECADFCGSNRPIERRLYRLQRQRRKLPGITGSEGNWYNSIQATECNLLVPDSPVTKFCPSKLMSAIYCIAWSFFLLQQTKTCNSQKYNELSRAIYFAVCMSVMCKLTY